MKINDFKVGDIAEIKHRITLADIDRFVELTGDDNPLHTDALYAARTSMKKPVVHGMLAASFISTIIGTKIPGEGALWFSQNLEFLLPVRVGDDITVRAEVLKIDERQQILDLKTDIFNQHRKKVVDGKARIKLIPQTENEKKTTAVNEVRTVLIFGATGGIGSALVKSLAASGQNLILHYHTNKAAAEILQKELKIKDRSLVVGGEIQSVEQVELICQKAVRKFGCIDAVVNCTTGTVPNIDFTDLTWEDFESQLKVQVRGTYNILKSVVPVMEVNKYGKIVFITTQAVEYPFSNLMPYITAKSALQGMVKSAALDLAKKGIRVNAVSPGITDTELNADLPEKVKLVTEARTPLKRLAKAEDVASAIAFLLSGSSDFITGETIRVNGGQVMI